MRPGPALVGASVEAAASGECSGQDRRQDAIHWARRLRLDDVVAVDQGAARDQVPGREDCRGDRVSARSRSSGRLRGQNRGLEASVQVAARLSPSELAAVEDLREDADEASDVRTIWTAVLVAALRAAAQEVAGVPTP